MAKDRQIEGVTELMPFAVAGAIVVETRAEELIAHADGVLDMAEIEGVHDMRVATRRLRAALEVFAPCFPKAEHKRVLSEVKAIADALGERRDRDVAIASLSLFAAEMPTPDRPGVASLIERFRAEQETANSALTSFVEPERLERLQASLRELAAAARGSVPGEAAGEANGEAAGANGSGPIAEAGE
jgi:CHAD domain-containing protein